MSLLHSIEQLQQAPIRKRKIVLTVSVLVIMVVIISLWIMQLKYTLSTTRPEHTASITEPMKLIWNSMKDSLPANLKSIYEKGK
ncbi:MAG: hypothetical protein AAB783_00905 [Patescibacteria group bacterium]